MVPLPLGLQKAWEEVRHIQILFLFSFEMRVVEVEMISLK